MRTEMSIDQQMAIIQEGLKHGASVSMNFHGVKSKEEAKKIMARMSELTGACVKSSKGYLSLNPFESPIDCTVFYKLSIEEQKEKLLQELNRMNAELAKGDEAIEKAN